MATLKLQLDTETYTALIEDAGRHLRPADWHAQAILRQALGLPFPYPADMEALTAKSAPEVSAS
jgi:hypothetical protein